MTEKPAGLLAARYRLVKSLGEGGMGVVWEARDELLDRDVAVKELAPNGLSEAELGDLRERAIREARAIARVDHPNVVRIFDVVHDDDDAPWIVMELVRSRSLHDVVNEDGPVTPERAAEIGLAVLSALRSAHDAGILHRDVKPANVLLATNGRIVLTDFGLAEMAGDSAMTRTGVVLGSPSYLAPERALDEQPGPAADLWSLGATLYAAVEGRPPYEKSSPMATLAALMVEPSPPPKQAGPLRPVLDALLRKNPAERATPDETKRLLQAVTSPDATTAGTPASVPQTSAAPASGAPASAAPASGAPASAAPASAASASGAPASAAPASAASASDAPALAAPASGAPDSAASALTANAPQTAPNPSVAPSSSSSGSRSAVPSASLGASGSAVGSAASAPAVSLVAAAGPAPASAPAVDGVSPGSRAVDEGWTDPEAVGDTAGASVNAVDGVLPDRPAVDVPAASKPAVDKAPVDKPAVSKPAVGGAAVHGAAATKAAVDSAAVDGAAVDGAAVDGAAVDNGGSGSGAADSAKTAVAPIPMSGQSTTAALVPAKPRRDRRRYWAAAAAVVVIAGGAAALPLMQSDGAVEAAGGASGASAESVWASSAPAGVVPPGAGPTVNSTPVSTRAVQTPGAPASPGAPPANVPPAKPGTTVVPGTTTRPASGNNATTAPPAATTKPATKAPTTQAAAPGFQIWSHETGTCLDARNTGGDLQLWSCQSRDSQRFTFPSDGTMRVLGMCVRIKGTGNGARLGMGSCTGATSQLFDLNARNDLVSTKVDKCVDVTDNNSGNGVPAQIWDCAGTDNQKWN
ncbi:serine/threonine protein kinase [Actinoplanes solisilvae]|uniref:serine/threonine protein kinase n=1 Tax=Actinoplanes solisilvae TaxID=2486853 RepID=UPI000FDA6FFC|nr:serine/threonine protein kinase [Actinoplanes solisilvae]